VAGTNSPTSTTLQPPALGRFSFASIILLSQFRSLCTPRYTYSCVTCYRSRPSSAGDHPTNHTAIASTHTQLELPVPEIANTSMCLVKVKQEEDVVVPYRVVQRERDRSSRRASHTSVRRYSRNEIVRESSPRRSASYVPVPAPAPLAIPAPQPVPVFVQPPPAPVPVPAPPSHHHSHAHYVEVSPRSSVTSRSSSPPRSEYVYREREVRRERAYSPEHSPRYEHFRYVEPAPSSAGDYERFERRDRSRSRARSRSRGYYDDPRGSYRETNTRVTMVNEDGRRRREYSR
jgi:hypothetical protein